MLLVFLITIGVGGVMKVSQAYDPPIGIPAPEFGIDDTHETYSGQRYDFDGDVQLEAGEEYKDAGNGPYTHYVDNSGACTNTDNPFGTAANPRCAVPTDLAAGSVVEIHGGPYQVTMSGKSQVILTANGTADKPIFFRGASVDEKPVFNSAINVRGQYLVVENIYFNNVGAQFPYRQNGLYYDLNHAAIRGCEFAGNGQFGHGSVIPVSSDLAHPVSNIVIYNNEIHHFGQHDAASENDYHGVLPGMNASYIWIVDNHIHHNGGDSVQVSYYSDPPDSYPQYIYIGRNDMHDDLENAVDLKGSRDIIVSQNEMHNYDGNLSQGGTIGGTMTVSHYDESEDHTERAWFIFNEMYNSNARANSVTGSCDEIYFIGNFVHDIHSSGNDAEAFSSWSSYRLYAINNTVLRADRGLDFSGTAGSAQATIVNNIFSGLNTDSYIILSYSDYASRAIVKNNLNYLSGGTPTVNGTCSDCISADPLFVNADLNNVRLSSASPAIDAGTADAAYEAFFSLYGVDIKKDIADIARPQGSTWDIGAFEYTSSSDSLAPSGPSGLSVY